MVVFVSKNHSMKTFRGNGGKVLYGLNLIIRWDERSALYFGCF